MILFVFLAATLRMSIDLEQPPRVQRVTVSMTSLRDKSVTVREAAPASTDELETLDLAPGAYDMTITADHHRPLRRRVVVDGVTTALGVVGLTRLPVIRGRVTPGATMRDANGRRFTPDANGAFAIEVDGDRPAYQIAEKKGLGTRVIDVPRANADADLGVITLGPPSSVSITTLRNVELELASGTRVITPPRRSNDDVHGSRARHLHARRSR